MNRGAARRARGFTLLELMIVVALIAILALLTVPFFMQRAIQQQVKEGLEFGEFAKNSVSVYWTLARALPPDNEAAGLPPPGKIIGTYVSSIEVKDGAITVTFGGKAMRQLQGKHLTLRPAYVQDATIVPISWVCGAAQPAAGLTVAGANATDIPLDQLPVACRI